MTEYDPDDDARKCYDLAIELRRQREADADFVARQNKVVEQLNEFLKEAIPQLYCGECDRYERDPIFLDVERCSKCGELIEGSDDA